MAVRGIVEQLLAKRGLSGDALDEFLDPSLKRLADVSALPRLAEAAETILPFIRDRRHVVVFGDYDCDGVCASAILATAFDRLGGIVDVFVPDRFSEGYGLTAASVDRLFREFPDVALVVTVDCGVTSVDEVKTIRDRGVSVVVTDHHTPPEVLPDCDVLVDPKVPAQSAAAGKAGTRDLCGAGIAFFLASALVSQAVRCGIYSGEKFAAPLLVLAGVATVVDIVPLLGQNRILVANALRIFRSAPIGLIELLLRAQRRPVDLKAKDFGFLLGPRINAAGRMASAREALDLMLESDRERARELAFRLDSRNAERKTVENRMSEEVLAEIGETYAGAVAVNGGASGGRPNWHKGVCGIVAARVLERCGVPVAVAVDGHGSVRAPEGYDVHAALTECAELLDRFGGHAAAGGFSVKEGRFDDFAKAFAAACAGQLARSGMVTGGRGMCDPEMWLDPGDITMELHEALSRMEPFGEGNPEPVFGLRGVGFSDIRIMGENGRHAAFSFCDRRIPRATWWNHGGDAERLRSMAASRFDITFTLDVSEWGGEEPHPELRICDVAAV